MNEFYLPQKIAQQSQYLIEKAIYEDMYEYRESDSITLKMLVSIILNQNIHLFVQVLAKKTLTQEEVRYLLEIVCTEGDNCFEFFDILYQKCTINEEILFSLFKISFTSNNLKVLKILFLEHTCHIKKFVTKDFIQTCIEKNPETTLIEFLLTYTEKSLIFTNELLQDIINNDYIKLFILYTKNQDYNDWNNYLDNAIAKNAYEIIDYILTTISTYKIQQDNDYYNDFFDYLVTENIDKVSVFLDKITDIKLLGLNNLEKLLVSFERHEDFSLLLFKYDLISINFNNDKLQQKIKKFSLNKKLKDKLVSKKIKEIKKI